jgi:dynein heavy chain, axonemal
LINTLINLLIVDLKDLELAFKGELTMTGYMEGLMEAIELNRIPTEWAKKSWKTSRALSSWVENLKQRLEQLNLWKDEPTQINKTICFLNRLYKPNSFMTAIKQVCAQKTGQGLNRLYIQTDVTKRFHWEPELQAQVAKVEEGCYCFGFLLEGASWDKNGNSIEESIPKQQYSALPVVWCKALLIQEGKEEKGVFKAPVYMTTARFTSYVFMSQLRTRQPAEKWVLAGAALILDVEGVSDAFYPGQKPPEDAEPKK